MMSIFVALFHLIGQIRTYQEWKMILLWTCLALWVVWICTKHYHESKSFPPGYPRYPFIGSLISATGTGQRVVMQSLKYWHQYGTEKLFGIFIGPYLRMVIIKDFQLAKQMSSLEVFNGRSPNWKRMPRKKGVVFAENDIWKHNRIRSLRVLKDLGFGKSRMSYIVEDEANALASVLNKHHGQDMQIHKLFNVYVLNVLWKLLANKRFKSGDKEIEEFTTFLKHTPEQTSHPLLFPLAKLFRRSNKYSLVKYWEVISDFLEKVIEEHKQDLEDNDKELAQDFIGVYVKDMKANPGLTQDNLIQLLADFFEAGSETMASTMSWMVMYLALYPDIQKKCVEEVERVLGDEPLSYEHKKDLPYSDATVLEFLRMSSVFYSSLMHVAKHDTVFEGYNIPKGTMMFYSIYQFHMDPALWGDPEAMRPERFLNEEGTAVITHDHFVPFGMGKRVCLAESLARMEIFLFTVHILRKFKISLPKYHEKPDKENAVYGISRYPKPFYVHIEARN